MKVCIGVNEYEYIEFEGDGIGICFVNDVFEICVEFV